MAWAYKNVPAFNLKAGDTVAFDLTEQNDVDIQLQIAMAPTTTNGGDVNSGPFTQIVPNTQIPANPRGNSTFGDYELTFTAQAPFNFPGGGLLIRFGNPGGAFASDSDRNRNRRIGQRRSRNRPERLFRRAGGPGCGRRGTLDRGPLQPTGWAASG